MPAAGAGRRRPLLADLPVQQQQQVISSVQTLPNKLTNKQASIAKQANKQTHRDHLTAVQGRLLDEKVPELSVADAQHLPLAAAAAAFCGGHNRHSFGAAIMMLTSSSQQQPATTAATAATAATRQPHDSRHVINKHASRATGAAFPEWT